jgi:hypothetical protein
MRRRQLSGGQADSLECFIDVVCNLIGVLLLMAIISALAVRENVYDVFTPVEQPAGKSTHYLFAATPEGICPFEKNEAFKKLKNNSGNLTAETRFFRYTRHSRGVICRPKNRPPEIMEKNISSVVDELHALRKNHDDNDDYFVYFNVSPDEKAFRMFRLARKELWDHGVRVGWAPLDPEKGLAFGRGGITPNPQG